MKKLEDMDLALEGEDPIGVLTIIKSKLRLKTKDFATILDVPVVKITKLLAKRIRLTEDEAKKLATHFDIDIFHFGRWYRIWSDPNYFDDPIIKDEIISLTNYLRLGYEKLVTENPNHPFVPMWKNTWGSWINNYYCIIDENGGLVLETKKAVSDEMNWLKKEKRKLHATINEIKKYEIIDTTKNKPMETTKINWYNDYLINESINEAVKDIIGTYTRLDINNPKHPNNKDWDVECNKWIEYKHTLPDMFIATEKEALEVKSKLQSEVLKLYRLEEVLINKINTNETT